MTPQVELLDVVAVLDDVPEFELSKGEVGTVVEFLGDGEAFLVEFSDDQGRAYGIHTLLSDQIAVLHTQGRSLRLGPKAA